MKTLFCIGLTLLVIGNQARSQASEDQPIVITVQILNELTGSPVDADLNWPGKGGATRIEKGKYTVSLSPDKEELLTITRDGYFDAQLKLDYATEKASPLHEIKLQPGIPQLHISILDHKSGETVTSAIDLFTMDESSVVFSEEVSLSPYTIDLEYDKVHVLQVRAPGYFSFKDTIDFKNVFDGRVRERKIGLVPLKEGNKISLNNIYFQENEANLTEFAKIMLVELTHVLEQQKGLVIEIGAYTDDIGTNEYNKALSEKRAMAVKKYLLEKGAKEPQLQTKGYGEAAPLVPNDTDAHRALNRRVEFKIMKGL